MFTLGELQIPEWEVSVRVCRPIASLFVYNLLLVIIGGYCSCTCSIYHRPIIDTIDTSMDLYGATLSKVAIGPALNSYSVGLNSNLAVRVRVGLRLGLGKSSFLVGRAKDQRLPAGPIATAFYTLSMVVYTTFSCNSKHS